jgi:glucokinase
MCTRHGTGSRTGSAATSTDTPPARAGSRFLAVDVGGTKLAAALVDDRGEVSGRAVVPTPLDRDADGLFDVLLQLVRGVRDSSLAEVAGCGVGCGGPMADGLVSPLNIPAWHGYPLQQTLADALGLHVVVDNDAKALALAEGWLGAASGVDNFLAMVVSTGVGGGLVVDGRLLDGRSGNAGHIGHVIVEPQGRWCVCGARGCLEAEASGPSIHAATGVAAAASGDDVKERTGTMVGRAIASVASLLDLELAVVGGSVALGFGEPFFEAAQRELSSRAQISFARHCQVVPVGLGELAPLVGACALAIRARHPLGTSDGSARRQAR